jgi:glyoxylase-like metal-dependent hydrolase (beta-lactamase superfamily II)
MTEGSIDLGDGGELKIFETVGHASHHLSFIETYNGGLFVGDAAGTYLAECGGVVVPTTPPPFMLDSSLAALDKLIALNPSALYFSHFGMADNAVNRLKEYKEQLKLWVAVAKQGVEAHRSIEQISQAIIQQDKALSSVIDYVNSHPVLQKTVLDNCVRGVAGYVEYLQTKQRT